MRNENEHKVYNWLSSFMPYVGTPYAGSMELHLQSMTVYSVYTYTINGGTNQKRESLSVPLSLDFL